MHTQRVERLPSERCAIGVQHTRAVPCQRRPRAAAQRVHAQRPAALAVGLLLAGAGGAGARSIRGRAGRGGDALSCGSAVLSRAPAPGGAAMRAGGSAGAVACGNRGARKSSSVACGMLRRSFERTALARDERLRAGVVCLGRVIDGTGGVSRCLQVEQDMIATLRQDYPCWRAALAVAATVPP